MSDKAKSFWRSVGNVINTISGLASILLIVFVGGRYVQTVDGHEMRITKIETVGSSSLLQHEAADEQAKVDLQRRLDRVEKAVDCIPEIRADIKWIRQALDK